MKKTANATPKAPVRAKARPPPRKMRPIHRAACDDDVEALMKLLREGADPNDVGPLAMTPLHYAAEANAARAAWTLIESGATVDSVDRYGRTPLWVAVYYSDDTGKVIGVLRKAGADPYFPTDGGQTPLVLARQIANVDRAQFFADLP